jgi:serine protease inhibitor
LPPVAVTWEGALLAMSTYQTKRLAGSLVVLTMLGVAAGCLYRTASPRLEEESPSEESSVHKERLKEMTPEIREVVKANDKFAFALYARLTQANPGQNLFFSPYSMSSALVMVAEGARSETAEEMGKVLGYPDSARHKGEEARTLPWNMTRIHMGMAALNDHFDAGSRPASKEARDKLASLRQALQNANEKATKLARNNNFAEFQAAKADAERLADEINKLQTQYDRYEMRIANALWGEKTYAFKQSYFDALDKYYHTSGFFPVDFKNDFENARQRINGWVEERTHHRIKDMISRNSFDAEAQKRLRLVLTNAIYFKGEWSEVFPKEATKDDDFHLANGKKQRVPMMAYEDMKAARYAAFRGDGTYFDTPKQVALGEKDTSILYPDERGFQMLELSYKGGEMSMVLIVPRSANGLPALEKKLNSADVQTWIDKMTNREVHVFVPRFKLETMYDMEDALQGMGMVRAFVDPRQAKGAQFDGMSASSDPAQKFYISKVLHKAFVEVNEKGTEAAAATAVSMAVGAAAPILMPFTPVFKADRPFVFLIRDVKTGSILFLGRMTNPK